VSEVKKCGIVRPISEIDGCAESHWLDVHNIFCDAIKEAKLAAELVSASNDFGVIQKRIVQNLYENDVILCDVSGRNPNVMFELGMRLAFDKPVVIVKDDHTPYSFDTSPIEHLEYPRDLRFSKIVEFKKLLTDKLFSAAQKSNGDFLSSFGEFKVSELDVVPSSPEGIVLQEIELIKDELHLLRMSLSKVDVRLVSGHGNPSPKRRSIASVFDTQADPDAAQMFSDILGNS
jgi:hypothetical protein